MRVLVCGSRTFEDKGAVHSMLTGLQYLPEVEVLTVIEGGAQGADSHAASWAERADYATHEQYPAKWRNSTGKFVKAAGVIRNQQMLDEGKPDIVLAFVDKPLQDSVGTYDMVKRARKAGVPVYLIWRM